LQTRLLPLIHRMASYSRTTTLEARTTGRVAVMAPRLAGHIDGARREERNVNGMARIKRISQVCPEACAALRGCKSRFHSINLRRVACFAVLAAAVGMVLLAPDALAAGAGNEVGSKLGGLLKQYASDVYGGLAGISSLVFLYNRRYGELAVFLLAVIVVGWLVFAPSSVGSAAEAIAKQIFG
jgi:hypothetical protein